MPDWIRRLAGKDPKQDGKKAQQASPPPNPYAFVVPSYLRGGPYSAQAVPTYADNPARTGVKDRYETVTEQSRELPQGFRPPSTEPPQEWSRYNSDNIVRSKEQVHVINADEGRNDWLYQRQWRPVLNPYWMPNQVNRIQRSPHAYSFLRAPDHNYLGQRTLTGEHYSAAQTVTDQQALSLKGMVPSRSRTTTVRVEPIAYGEFTNSVARRSGYAPKQASATAEDQYSGFRSFRLT